MALASLVANFASESSHYHLINGLIGFLISCIALIVAVVFLVRGVFLNK